MSSPPASPRRAPAPASLPAPSSSGSSDGSAPPGPDEVTRIPLPALSPMLTPPAELTRAVAAATAAHVPSSRAKPTNVPALSPSPSSSSLHGKSDAVVPVAPPAAGPASSLSQSPSASSLTSHPPLSHVPSQARSHASAAPSEPRAPRPGCALLLPPEELAGLDAELQAGQLDGLEGTDDGNDSGSDKGDDATEEPHGERLDSAHVNADRPPGDIEMGSFRVRARAEESTPAASSGWMSDIPFFGRIFSAQRARESDSDGDGGDIDDGGAQFNAPLLPTPATATHAAAAAAAAAADRGVQARTAGKKTRHCMGSHVIVGAPATPHTSSDLLVSSPSDAPPAVPVTAAAVIASAASAGTGAVALEYSKVKPRSLPTPISTGTPLAGDGGSGQSLLPFRALLRRGKKLGELRATAICGNDATGSLFYMVGQTALEAGVLAPVAAALVSVTLYLFRAVYGEAVTALPLNGGAYNVLLNTTKKTTAAFAAVLTLLSYVATAVVCASEAGHYLVRAFGGSQELIPVFALAVLIGFAALSCLGVGESASVATGVFVTHIATMTVLLLFCCWHVLWAGVSETVGFAEGKAVAEEGLGFPLFYLRKNWRFTFETLQPKAWLALFYGFSAAMLGVTGFESSANYVEEQKPGVFVKTLRNMWILCSIFNISVSYFAVTLLDLPSLFSSGHAPTAVAALAKHVGGRFFDAIVCADACLVLSGGVLTAYVGVSGLVRRMALDRCLPQVLLVQNTWRGTYHWIMISFCAVCCSLFSVLEGDVKSLAQTYSLAFLFVMSLFALGVLLIKTKRATLVAEVTASWPATLTAFAAALAAAVGAVMRDPAILPVFSLYFACACGLVLSVVFRVHTLALLARVAGALPCRRCAARRYPGGGLTLEQVGQQKAGYGSVNDVHDDESLIEAPLSASRLSASSSSLTSTGEHAPLLNPAGSSARQPEYGRAPQMRPLGAGEWSVFQWLVDSRSAIVEAPMGFFTKTGALSVLNKAVLYIKANEDCKWVNIIHVFEDEHLIPPSLVHNVNVLADEYPDMRLDLVLVKGTFSPAVVAYVSVRLGIGRNHLFITTPQPGFALRLEDLGGVRLITH